MPEKQIVIGTITELAPNHVVVNTLEYGYITIKRDENWDGGVCWDFTKRLKPGDQVDILRTYKNNLTQKPSYGFYGLGTLLNSPARNPNEIAYNKKLMDFIEKKEQEAVVIDYWYSNDKYNSQPMTHIKCWNPVWKEIEFYTNSHIPLRYNDVIIIKKYTKSVDYYAVENKTLTQAKYVDYYVVENKTLTQERQQIIKDVLLRDFNDVERQKILLYQANTNQK